MKKSNKIILAIVIVLLLISGGIGAHFIMKDKDISKEVSYVMDNNSESLSKLDISNEIEENNNEIPKEDTDKYIYFYSSGDNSAAHGNPELLYVYKISDNSIEFKYHAPWNTNDIKGTATKVGSDIYAYTNGDYKVELMLNSMGENSVKVTEYKNGEVCSWKNLWKDEGNNPNKDQNTTVSSNAGENNSADDLKKTFSGKYLYSETSDMYYHRSDVKITNMTASSMEFSISAVHGRNIDNVNIGEVSGLAKKIAVPEDQIVAGSEQLAYEFKEDIDGKSNSIVFVFTAHRKFTFLNISENYENDFNPYAGHNVYFAGEYEKTE